MNWIKALATLGLSAILAGCGGGGGSAGASGSGGGGTGGTGTGAAFLMNLDVQRAGSSTIQISSTETVQATATVTTSAGAPVEGVVVTFFANDWQSDHLCALSGHSADGCKR